MVTGQPRPGLKVPSEERLAAMQEALDRTDQEHDEPVVDLVPDDEVVVEPVDMFDARAYAEAAWERAGRVRVIEKPAESGDVLARVLGGDDSAMHDMALRFRRGGGRWSINASAGTCTPKPRR